MTCPGDVRLVVHDPIPTAGLTRDDARGARRARAGDRRVGSRSSDWEPEMDLDRRLRRRRDRAPGLGRRRAGACRRARSETGRAAARARGGDARSQRSPPTITAAVRTMYKRVGHRSDEDAPVVRGAAAARAEGRRAAAHQQPRRRHQLVLARVAAAVRALRSRPRARRRHAAARARRARSTPGIRKDIVHVAGRLTLADDDGPVRQSDVRLGAHDGHDRRRRARWS